MGRRFSTTPIAARRASSILRPSIEDDLSMISTTARAFGRARRRQLGGQRALQRVLGLALLVHVDVVLAGDPDEAAALLDVVFQRGLGGPAESISMSQLLITTNWKSSSFRARRRVPAALRTGWPAARASCAPRWRRDRARPAARADCAASRHPRSAPRPDPSAEILPASAIAPTELTLACRRR